MVTVGFFVYCMLTVVFGFSKNIFSSIRSLWDAMNIVKVVKPVFNTVETVTRQILSNGKELIVRSVSRKKVGTETNYYRKKTKRELRQEQELYETQQHYDDKANKRAERMRRREKKRNDTGGVKRSSNF